MEICPDAYGRKKGGQAFFLVVPNRTRVTLTEVIKTYVRPGTHIITDGWAAYNHLSEEGYTHTSVNHSRFYMDPATGAHTNTIEGKWNGVKKVVPRQGFRTPYVLQTYLGETMFRAKYNGNMWKGLLDALRTDSTMRATYGQENIPMPFMLCRDE